MRGIIFTFSYCCCIKASCYICSSNICFINLGVLKFKSLYLVSPTHVKTRSHTHSPQKIKKGFCVIMWVKIIFDWSLVHNIVTFCLYFFFVSTLFCLVEECLACLCIAAWATFSQHFTCGLYSFLLEKLLSWSRFLTRSTLVSSFYSHPATLQF